MQTVVIKKGESVQIIAETLEAYPINVTWADALNVAAGKIQNDARAILNTQAQVAMQATNPPAAPLTPVQPQPAVDPANDVGAGQAVS
jgi:hypothetical protein